MKASRGRSGGGGVGGLKSPVSGPLKSIWSWAAWVQLSQKLPEGTEPVRSRFSPGEACFHLPDPVSFIATSLASLKPLSSPISVSCCLWQLSQQSLHHSACGWYPIFHSCPLSEWFSSSFYVSFLCFRPAKLLRSHSPPWAPSSFHCPCFLQQ